MRNDLEDARSPATSTARRQRLSGMPTALRSSCSGAISTSETSLVNLTEMFGGAAGARTFDDGVDIGGLIANPISRMANVETLESSFPIRYLFRRRRINSGGAGKYRGGTGMELAIVPHDAPDGGLHYVISGKGQMHAMTDGLAGGYPGSRNRYVWVHSDGRDNEPTMAWQP